MELHYIEMINLSILASKPRVYPREYRVQGGGHPGWGANTSQGTITHIHTLIQQRQLRDANKSPMHDFGLRGETPEALGEHVGIEPLTLGVRVQNVPTTKPPSPPIANLLKYYFNIINNIKLYFYKCIKSLVNILKNH